MKVALVTGSGGLIGSESVEFFAHRFDLVLGIDNDLRRYFFGETASTAWNVRHLQDTVSNYRHYSADIRDEKAMQAIFSTYGTDLACVIHTAAQPSHDWAANEPFTDFTVNANGTLILLEMTRRFSPEAVFIHCSTNKVYGDTPNRLPLVEQETRWEIADDHPYHSHGIDESMSIDHCKHSLFGASKVAADVLVQEYGRYFDMKTACFRGGCLTGPRHSGAQLHGFLSWLVKCCITGEPYTVFGYGGKQVRDNIHSWDLINMFWHFYQAPRSGEVYNAGGSRHSNCSVLEAIHLAEEISGNTMRYSYSESNRIGDHIWWISDVRRFQSHFPDWSYRYTLADIMTQIHEELRTRV